MTDRLLALNIIYFFSRTTGPISIKLGTTYLEQLLGIYIDEFLAGCSNFRWNGLFEIEWVSHKIFISFYFFYFLSFLSRGHNLSFEHNQRRFCAHLKWYQSICSKKGKLKMKVEVIYKIEEIISRTFCRWWWVRCFGCHKMLWWSLPDLYPCLYTIAKDLTTTMK